MSHPENDSIQSSLITQLEELYRQSFIFSEKMISEIVARNGLDESARKDLIVSALPVLAMELRNQMSSVAQMSEQTNSTQIDRMYDAVQKVIDELRRRNSVAGK